MRKIQVAVVGSTGKMGIELQRLLREDSVLEFTVGISRSKVQHLEKTIQGFEELDASHVDLVIDFSLPEAAERALNWCLKNKKPLVSGTTGIKEDLRLKYVKAGEQIPVIWSPNMSLGIAILNKVIAQLPRVEGFDFQIEEFHHAQKKDKPSGTALFLQESLEARLGQEVPTPLSIRGGGIFGLHRVHMMGTEETLTFEHNALNRAIFAKGAIVASKWLKNKPAGFYQMANVLGDM